VIDEHAGEDSLIHVVPLTPPAIKSLLKQAEEAQANGQPPGGTPPFPGAIRRCPDLGQKGRHQRPRFQPRESQIELAEAIDACIRASGTLMAEAGTGTGKTFAYLVPVLQSGRKAIISTGTKNLQQQLFERDLPQVADLLGIHPRLRLLKGRGNYACTYRLNQARASAEGKKPAFAASLRIIDPWLRRTRDGDLMELSGLPDNSPVWPHIRSTADNCLGSECPDFEDCYVMRARRRAQEADVLVVNHHLLFADPTRKRKPLKSVAVTKPWKQPWKALNRTCATRSIA